MFVIHAISSGVISLFLSHKYALSISIYTRSLRLVILSTFQECAVCIVPKSRFVYKLALPRLTISTKKFNCVIIPHPRNVYFSVVSNFTQITAEDSNNISKQLIKNYLTLLQKQKSRRVTEIKIARGEFSFVTPPTRRPIREAHVQTLSSHFNI